MRSSPWLSALVVLVVALAAAEFAARQWLVSPQAAVQDPRFGLVQRPGTRVVQSREGWSEYRANSLGVLDDEPRGGPGSTLAVLFGDSFGQGLQVARGERLTEVAERELPGLSFLDLARAGRSPMHHALLAPRMQEALHPRVVVLQVGDGDFNDIETPAMWDDAHAEAEGTLPGVPRPGEPAPSGAASWLKHSSLLVLLRSRVEQLLGQEQRRLGDRLTGRRPDLRDVVALPVPSPVVQQADSLVGVVQAVNPRLVMLYIPVLTHHAGGLAEVRYPGRRALWSGIAARRGITWVDPSDSLVAEFARTGEPLQGFPNARPADGHTNARGHAVLGRMVARAIATEAHREGGGTRP
jgi:hypothetical protein